MTELIKSPLGLGEKRSEIEQLIHAENEAYFNAKTPAEKEYSGARCTYIKNMIDQKLEKENDRKNR